MKARLYVSKIPSNIKDEDFVQKYPRINCNLLNCNNWPDTCIDMKVKKFPTVRKYTEGKSGHKELQTPFSNRGLSDLMGEHVEVCNPFSFKIIFKMKIIIIFSAFQIFAVTRDASLCNRRWVSINKHTFHGQCPSDEISKWVWQCAYCID